jgi:hypothetical protein
MADKKEVLDYLRNQQKAAEIEAKINGVNIWVLFGAMAVVGWQLTGSAAGGLWNDYELFLRTLVASIGLHMLSWLIRRSNADHDELRYSRTNFVEMDSPFLVLLEGVLLVLPPVGLILVAGKSIGAIGLSLLGLALIAFSTASLLKPLFPTLPSKEKFPKPEFGLTRRADLISDLFSGALFFVAIAEQIGYVRAIQGGVSLEDARQMGLLAALYLLILIAVDRRRQNDSIAWTYEMETDLVLDAISPEVAVRRIENRRLGPRLQDVVNRFFDDLDQRFSALDSMLSESKEKVCTAKQIPEQYPAERAARMKEASETVGAQIDGLTKDCEEFRSYIKKLEQKLSGGRRAVLVPVLASLKTRYESYDDRARAAKLELKQLLA